MSFSEDEIERYARHLVLSEVGGPGQQALKRARVAVVGLGGVGGPAALYLAAAGVGGLVLIDDDAVALSNLQRQVQFGMGDLGAPKVEAAKARLADLNPHATVEAVQARLTPDNAAVVLAGANVVIDGTDDFATRFAVNAACMETGVPLVSGSLGRWIGQVAVFAGKPCYRCLVSEIPPEAETCARVGVVGALAGVVGSMAALEAVKIVAGAGQALTGRLMVYDGLAGTARTATITPDPDCPVCS